MEQVISLSPVVFAGVGMAVGLPSLLVMQLRSQKLVHALVLQMQHMRAGYEATTATLLSKISDSERVIEQLDLEVSRLLGKVRELNAHQSSVDFRRRDAQRYGDALRLARQGSSLDLLMDTCGLNKGEADLVMQLNKENMPHCVVPVSAPAQRASQSMQARALASALSGSAD